MQSQTVFSYNDSKTEAEESEGLFLLYPLHPKLPIDLNGRKKSVNCIIIKLHYYHGLENQWGTMIKNWISIGKTW